ncbi:hypothetical protein [Myroides injenensis]|uniref:hypothetical protein n=1 Tax=Myroides injenensis TaxID=1183151 RepID=UPI00226E042F|nr:hypothetical protein [Myroides injenensis]
MKKISLLFLFIAVIVTSCSKSDDYEDYTNNQVKVKYVGQTYDYNLNTKVLFSVKNDLNYIVEGYLKVETVGKEVVKSEKFYIGPRSSSSVYVTVKGILQGSDYINSTKVFINKNANLPGSSFNNPLYPNYPTYPGGRFGNKW